MSERSKSTLGYAAAFVAPVSLLCVLCAFGNVYPFGGADAQSFLTEDLRFQYVDFFTWYRSVLTGQESLFYSFAQSLGSNMWGLYSYYLASPFNLLLLAFDESKITLAIFVICAFKLGCIGLSVAFYLRHRFELGHVASVVGALCFCGSTWVLSNLRNPMWLDAIIVLPIMLWAVWRLVHTGKWGWLCACAVAAIVTCWYMAYMILVFCTLMFVFEWVVARGNSTGALKLIGRYALCMLVALGLSAWTFVPSVLVQSASGATSNLVINQYSEWLFCGFSDILGALFATNWTLNADPQMYCGVLILVLAAFFFVSRVDLRTKIAAAVMLVVLVASIWLIPLQRIWCGFGSPNGFYCRIAFSFAFFVLWLAAAAWRELEDNSGRVFMAAGLVLALLVFTWLVHGLRDANVLLLNAALVIVYAVLLALGAKMFRSAGAGVVQSSGAAHSAGFIGSLHLGYGALACVILALLFELGISGQAAFAQFYMGYTQAEHDAYMAEASGQIAELKATDSGIYRVEKTYARQTAALNEGMALGFMQLSGYSSAQNIKAVNFLSALGYSNPGEFSVSYTEPVLLTNTLLGVRYVYTDDGLAVNSDALALGYGISVSALDTTIETAEFGSNNPFAVQNQLVSALLGESVVPYVEVSAVPETLQASAASQTWNVEVPDNAIAYAYVVCPENKGITLTITDGSESRIMDENSRFSHSIRRLNSDIGAEQTVQVSIVASDGSELPEGATCLFCYLDLDVYGQVVSQLGAHQFEATKVGDAQIVGTYEASSDGYMLLSIPYDAGWSLSVNGYGAEPVALFDGDLMAVPVTAGENQIEMKFTPRGLLVGCAVTGVMVAALGVGAFFQRRHR